MKNYTLSILIPARNEQFLAKTVQDIIEHKQSSTEIIVGLDGEWATPPVEQHPDVTVVYYPESIGQRAMTNQLCKLSKAQYVMKCDAHCTFDDGFDTKMIDAFKEVGDNVIMAPTMRNLHAFDWVCVDGHRRYQGKSGPCHECNQETHQELVWIGKTNPQSNSFCFDSKPHFQYFNAYVSKQDGNIVESMSLQGSCFMLSREKYWELNVCDEDFGSWGSQGIELSCKFWLSGGRVLINKNTWYAHLFRTAGGDFSFPYPQKNSQVEHAKAFAKNLFFNNLWEKQIYPLSWLVEKFWPVNGWSEEDLKMIQTKANSFGMKFEKGIVYYTDNNVKWSIAQKCRKSIIQSNLPIVSVSHKKADIGENIILKGERSPLQMYKQIMAGLKASKAKYIFLCEHDVIYNNSHFDFIPPTDTDFYFNTNVWKVRYSDGFAIRYSGMLQNSGLCASKDLLMTWVSDKIKQCDEGKFDRHYEPLVNRIEWKSKISNYDIRHDSNLTKNRWKISEFRNKPSEWEETSMFL